MIPAEPAKVRFNEKLDHLQARRPFTYNLVTGALIGAGAAARSASTGPSSSPTPCRGLPSGGSSGGTAGSCAASTKRARCASPRRRKPSAASAETAARRQYDRPVMPSTPRIASSAPCCSSCSSGWRPARVATTADDDGVGPRDDLVDRAAGGPRRAGAVAAGHRGGRDRRDQQQLRGDGVPAGARGRRIRLELLHVTGEGTRANGVPFSVEVVRIDHRARPTRPSPT